MDPESNNNNNGYVITRYPEGAATTVGAPDYLSYLKGLGSNLAGIGNSVLDFGKHTWGTEATTDKNGVVTPATGLGGISGAGGLAANLAPLITGYLGYKETKKKNNMIKGEIDRTVRKETDFANSINKSGLGTTSAGI